MNAIQQSRFMGQAISEKLYTGYAQANNQRLAQVVSKKITAAQAASGLHPTMSMAGLDPRSKTLSFEQSGFLKNYRNNMLDLQEMAADMTAKRGEIRETMTAGSDNPAVAEVSGRLAEITDRYTVEVQQVASGQISRSAPMEAEDSFPTASGSLRLATEKGRFDLYMSGAGLRDNQEMLESFADKINAKDTGVTATVAKTDDGKAYLQLESDAGGDSGFDVLGTLAKTLKIEKTDTPVQEAVYSVTKNGGDTQVFTSDTNNVTLDEGITALLKSKGTANVSSVTDAAEGVADRLSKMVGKYNDTLSFLKTNSARGTGVQNQLRRMTDLSSSQKDLETIGVTRERDGSLRFDRDTFLTQARRAPSRANEVVERFAEDLRSDARQGMKESSGSLVGPLEYVQRAESTQLDPVNVLSTYSRNGVYNLMNLYAAGVLMNLNA